MKASSPFDSRVLRLTEPRTAAADCHRARPLLVRFGQRSLDNDGFLRRGTGGRVKRPSGTTCTSCCLENLSHNVPAIGSTRQEMHGQIDPKVSTAFRTWHYKLTSCGESVSIASLTKASRVRRKPRPGLDACLDDLRAGDVLVPGSSIGSSGTSSTSCRSLRRDVTGHRLRSVTEGVRTKGATGNAMLTITAAIA